MEYFYISSYTLQVSRTNILNPIKACFQRKKSALIHNFQRNIKGLLVHKVQRLSIDIKFSLDIFDQLFLINLMISSIHTIQGNTLRQGLTFASNLHTFDPNTMHTFKRISYNHRMRANTNIVSSSTHMPRIK